MPQVVPFFAGALGIGTAGAGIGLAAGWQLGSAFAATALGGIAVNLLTSVALSALSVALQGKPKSQVAGMRTDQTLGGGVNPEGFILGGFATNGALVAPYMSHGNSGKTPNAFLNYVIELGGVSGQTLEGLVINGEAVELLADNPHPDYGQRIGGRFEDRAWIRYYDGTQTAADPMLLAKYPVPHVRPWTADMVGTGICYAVLTFQFDREVFQSWPTVRFVMGGIPVYDPRRDSTQPGGSGTQRWGQPSTYRPSANNAVLVYNIMRGIRLPGGAIWGGDIPPEDLPLPVWISAMDTCDVQVNDGAGGLEAQYRAGLEIMVEDEPWAVVEELLRGCIGALAEGGGVWTIRVGAPGLPVMHITDADLLSDAPDDFKPFPTLDQIYNAIEATYPDPDSNWESRDADPIHNADWEAEDDGRRLTASVALNAVPYPVQVSRIMTAMILDHRRMRSHVIVLPPEAGRLQALDVITWTSGSNFYDAKLMEVKEVSRDLIAGRVTVTLREVDPEDYDPPANPVRPSPPDLRPLLPQTQAVPGWAVQPWRIKDAEGVDRRPGVRLSWDRDAADDARGIRFAIRMGGETTTGTETATHDHRAGVAEIELLPATVYEVRARFVVDRATVWSDWISVLTPDIRIGLGDVDSDMATWLETMHGWLDSGIGNLPEILIGLEGGISQEVTDRIAALEAETAARIAAINAVAEQVEAEKTARIEAVGEISDALAEEVTTRRAQAEELASSIAAETVARLEGLGLTAQELRRHGDRIRALAAQVIELGFTDQAAREEIRRSLTVQLGAMGAQFAEQILTLVDADLAAATRIVTLEAGSADQQAQISQVEVAMVTGYDALAAMISALSVGNALMFDHVAVWYFDTSVDGWTGSPANPTVADGWIRPATGSNLISPTGIGADGAAYKQVRARVRRIGAPVWWGVLWWAGAGQDWSAARSLTIAEPVWDGDEAIITFNADWSGEIDRIRLDLIDGPSAEHSIAVDWAAIGRPAPGASAADLQTLRRAMIEGDEALAEAVEVLEARIGDAEGNIAGQANAITELTARTAETESGVEAAAGRVELLEAEVRDPATGLPGLATAIEEVRATSAAEAGSQIVQSEAIRALTSALRRVAAQGIEGAAVAHSQARAVREYIASASQQLNTRIDASDAEVLVLAEAVTLLQAAIPGLASADAMQALIATVTEQGNSITTLSQALTSLGAVVEGKAEADALAAVLARVEETETGLLAEGQRIDSLSATVNNPTTGLGSKASAAAVSSLNLRVEDVEEATGANAEAITQIKLDVEGLGGTVAGKASQEAMTALTGRVESTEDGLTVTTQALTDLAARVEDAETGLPGLASALDYLNANAVLEDGSQVYQAEAIRALTTALKRVAAQGIEGAAVAHSQARAVREYIASASQQLNTRVDVTDAEVVVLAEAVSLLKAAIPGLASADAMQALIATVTDQGNSITSLSQALTNLGAVVEGKAEAGALAAVLARVEETETGLIAEGQRIDSLSATINNPTTGLGSKASIAATNDLGLRIEATEQGLVSVGQSITSLQSDLDGKASMGAVAGLTARMEAAEGAITTQGDWIVNLQNSINDPATGLASKASQQALQSLQSTVAAQGESLTIQGAAITSLISDLDGKASATAVGALTTRVEEVEGKANTYAEALTQVGILNPDGVAQAMIRLAAEDGPAGVLARIGLRALVGDSSDNTRVAALFLEALAGGQSRVVVQADRFVVTDGSGYFALFEVVDGQIFLRADLIRLNGNTIVEGDFRVTGDMIAGDAVSRIAFSSTRGTGPNVNTETPSIIVVGSGTGAEAPAEITPVPYGVLARNRLVFTLCGTAFIGGAVEGRVEFRIEGEGSDGSWNYLDPLTLQRPLSWSAAQNQQYIPFTFVMDDIDGDVFREGLGGPFSRFRVRATLIAGAGASVGFSFMSLRIEQLNK